MDFLEEILHILVESGSTYDHFIKAASECVHEFRLHLIENHLVQKRETEQLAYSVLLQNRTHLVLVDFLYHQRHGNHEIRLDFVQGLHNDLRTRNSGEEMYVCTADNFIEDLEHKTVHMC